MSLLLLMGGSAPNVASLFANNEAGLALDVETAYRRGWIFQDSAGATVAAAAGDPVGLILDTSKGGLDQLGSELVTNGRFDTTSNWSQDYGGTFGSSPGNWVISGGAATITNAAGNYALKQTGFTLSLNKTYLIEYDLTGSDLLNLRFGGDLSTSNIAKGVGSGTRKRVIASPPVSTTMILFQASTGGTTTIDNISIREIPGNHAYQTTSGSRPLLARTPDGGRRNLLTYSEQFDNAAWSKTTATITANAVTAPDGTTTADQVVFDTAETSRIQQSVTSSTSEGRCYSIYMRCSSGTMTIRFGDAGNLQNHTVTDTWQRFSATHTGINPNVTIRNESGGGAKTLFLWGAQLEVGSSATNLQKVGLTSDVTESGKRDCWGLLFDGSDDSLQTSEISFNTWTQATRRNLLTNTESFSISPWVRSNSTATDNSVATLDPLGTNTACKFIDDAVNATHHMYQPFTLTANTTYTYSIYAKAAERSWIMLGTDNSTAEGVFFDLQNGAVGNAGTGYSGTIANVGNGWYRCSVVFNSTTATAANYWQVALATGNGTILFTGTGTSGVYLWGAQLEAGTLTDYQRVGTDKMTVMAGVRKSSDAARGTICELTATIASNNGGFHLTGPNAASDTFAFESKGTSLTDAVATGIAAPATRVLTGIGNIAGDSTSLRVNGAVADTDTGDQGTGNYANAILYIGSRAGSSLRFNGILYTLIIRGATTTTGTIADFEKNLLARRCGVTF